MNLTFISIMVSSLLMCLSFSLSANVAVNSANWGRVNMKGSIIDSACAIDAGSREQTIDMAEITTANMMHNDVGAARFFTIHFINCTLPASGISPGDKVYFRLTFDGPREGSHFGVSGYATGVALQLTDAFGNIIEPGVPVSILSELFDGMKLKYSFRLIKNNHLLQAGEYSTAVRFKMDYY